MKKLIGYLILLTLTFSCLFNFNVAVASDSGSIEQQISTLEQEIEELEEKQANAFLIVQGATGLNLAEDNDIYVQASKIWFTAYNEKLEKQEQLESLKKELAAQPKYTQEDLMLLAKVIYSEAGSNWLSDEHQRLVGQVVLNRVADESFPDTIEEVVYQKGQYSSASRLNSFTPDERTIANARWLLEGNRIAPADVVYQANFPQGSYTYKVITDSILGSTYFCGK